MKGKLTAALLLVLVLLCACSSRAGQTADAGANTVRLQAGEWPENAYTKEVPEPAAGTVANGWIDEEKGYCYLEIEDISETEAADYLDSLRQAGFTEMEKASEKLEGQDLVSVGSLLSDGTTDLSIAVLSGHLGMYISLRN